MAFKDRLYAMPVLGTALRVQDRYKADAGDQFAGAIGFFGFLSLFPLLLLALSAVGFVLADASDQQLADVVETIQGAIPGFSAVLGEGEGIAGALDAVIENRGAVAGVGLVTVVLSGLRIVNSAQTAALVIFRIDLLALSGVKRKVQQLVALVLLGLLAIVGVVAASSLGVLENLELFGVMEVLAPVLIWVGTYLLDVLLFLVTYKLLSTVDGPSWRRLVPGALFAGLGWTLLKGFGATYVSQQVARAGDLYGTIGSVIGLLLLLYLAGRLYVYGAELSAVRAPDPDHPSDGAGDEVAGTGAGDFGAAADRDTDLPRTDRADNDGPDHDEPSHDDDRSTADRARLAPTASEETRTRLAAMPEPPRGGQGRQALAFALGVGALAGLVGVLRPWEKD